MGTFLGTLGHMGVKNGAKTNRQRGCVIFPSLFNTRPIFLRNATEACAGTSTSSQFHAARLVNPDNCEPHAAIRGVEVIRLDNSLAPHRAHPGV